MFDTALTSDALLAASALSRRFVRQRDTALESKALDVLIARINAEPRHALQALAGTIIDLCGSGSAGVSVLEGDHFIWPAIAGEWDRYVERGLPRDASPCGVVIERNTALLFDHPKRIFPSIDGEPEIAEILLVPLVVEGVVRGTVWAISHDAHRFDSEDVRIFERMGLVAGSIEAVRQLRDREQRQANSARQRIRSTLAIMRLLVRRSDENAQDFESAAIANLSSRLGAYAEGAAGRGGSFSVGLWPLISTLLARHGETPDDRITLSGDHVELSSDSAGPFALAIHELLGNAFDFGALTRPTGRVDISWSADHESGAPRLNFSWQEIGGPGLEGLDWRNQRITGLASSSSRKVCRR